MTPGGRKVDIGGGGGGGGGGGAAVISAGPEGCSSSSWLSLKAPRLVETLRRSTQLRRRFLNLFVAVFKLICGLATPSLRKARAE